MAFERILDDLELFWHFYHEQRHRSCDVRPAKTGPDFCRQTALTQSGIPISGHSHHCRRISNNGSFTATDAFSPDRILVIRGVLAGLYS